jgi:hypothetical protein
VAVVHTDGTAIQPAPTGTVVYPTDEIRTLSASGALITFFTGTEIEMGDETVLVVDRVSRQGDRIDVSLKQVLGTSVSRVQALADAGASFRVDAGGAIALVRGSELAVHGPEDGLVAFVNVESTAPIVVGQCTILPGMGVWFEFPIENRNCNFFRAELKSGPWNAVLEGWTTAEQGRQGDVNRKPAGHVQAGRVNETRSESRKSSKDSESTSDITAPPLGPFVISGTCLNRAAGGSDCNITGSNLPGAQVGGVPTIQMQTHNPGNTNNVTTETFSCGAVNGSLITNCTFHTVGKIFQYALGEIFYPLAAGGQDSRFFWWECYLPSGTTCADIP